MPPTYNFQLGRKLVANLILDVCKRTFPHFLNRGAGIDLFTADPNLYLAVVLEIDGKDFCELLKGVFWSERGELMLQLADDNRHSWLRTRERRLV